MLGEHKQEMTIDDMEDFSDQPVQRLNFNSVTRNQKIHNNSINHSTTQPNQHSFLPGTHKVWVKTWGCGHNNSDGEYMAGLLAANGYDILLEDSLKDDADVWVLNSCTVKGPSEQTFVNEIRKAKDNGKSVIVSGCVPQASPKGKEWDGLSIIGVQQIDRVVEVVEETIKGNTVRLLKERKDSTKKKTGGASLDMPKIRKNPFIEIIPINTGCLNQCTYCKTKHARGDLGSYEPEEIIARVENVLAEGVVEIWLTSEDLGAYGHDIDVRIPDLLWGIVEAIERCDPSGVSMLRLGMTNPPYILDHLDEIAKILAHPRVFSFIHIPVQAASNKVLDDMRRQYTIQDFKRVVDTLREHIPRITVATDIICGFPTETEGDFEESLELLSEYQFPVLHISQFYPRPGTPAARMPLIKTQEIKRRSREATKVFESYVKNYESDVGTILSVLVTDRSGDGIHYIAHDKYYRQILIPISDLIMGKRITVKVTSFHRFYLKATLVPTSPIISSQSSTSLVQPVKKKIIVPRLVRVRNKLVRMENTGDDTTVVTDDKQKNKTPFELSMGTGKNDDKFIKKPITFTKLPLPSTKSTNHTNTLLILVSIYLTILSSSFYYLQTSPTKTFPIWRGIKQWIRIVLFCFSAVAGSEIIRLLIRKYKIIVGIKQFIWFLTCCVGTYWVGNGNMAIWDEFDFMGKVVLFLGLFILGLEILELGEYYLEKKRNNSDEKKDK